MGALEESPEEPEEAKATKAVEVDPSLPAGGPSVPAGGDLSVEPVEESDNGETQSDESSHKDDADTSRSKDRRRLATAQLTPSEKALRRRRLSNHPKSHVVVLERLMEEINRLN